MERFTKAEITWIIEELDGAVMDHRNVAQNSSNQGIYAGLHQLRAEQLESIVKKFRDTLTDGAKRIEVKY